jgi:hypothetical protein
MRANRRKRAQRLRLIVDTLPYETRVAMLEGLMRYEIIAGAYSDRAGGVCPMLAAHRCGGRTDLRSFARAWDRFTGTGRRARRASERELRTLTAQLETSLWREDQARYAHSSFGPAEPGAREQPPSAPAEVAGQAPAENARKAVTEVAGAWLLPFRDWDEYRNALELAMRQIEGEPAADQVAEKVAEKLLSSS